MRLSSILEAFYNLPVEADRDISRLELDSRHVKKGDLFLAVKGTAMDGRKFIEDAISRGATAVLVDAEQGESLAYKQSIPLIPIEHLREKIGPMAARFYDFPAKKLQLLGVTGTNGKTSITHFIAQAIAKPCGVMGTLGSGMYGALGEAGLTTPDAVTLQATLQKFVESGAKIAAMEVSSHSIDQGRVNGVPFDIGIFTNLTQDHLDYHGTMEAYAAVKHQFLAGPNTKHVILNADDDYGKKWIQELSGQKSVCAYSTKAQTKLPVPCVYADQLKLSLNGIHARIISPWGEGELTLPLIGQFNLSNVLAVLAALCHLDVPFPVALERLSYLQSVPGRMQRVGGGTKPLAIVDYSHTPDSLEKALEALRAHTEGKLICVFGCGGDRDQGKRPKMAAIAERLADKIIVTNDNPRHEQPEEIAKQIMAGFTHPERVLVELNRSKAIENSIQWATVNDCVLIAGKGAERYQQIGEIKTPFDDVSVVTETLNVSLVK